MGRLSPPTNSRQARSRNMAKLSNSLKALINVPFARPGPTPAPAVMRDVLGSIASDAVQKKIGTRPWLAISTAATFTLNSPDSLPILHAIASSQRDQNQVQTAEFMREVGLKCISFNGIPRTINCLNAFYASLPKTITSRLSTSSSRAPTPSNLGDVSARGRQLWDSIYAPFENKLVDKLALSHPDLPVHILNCHYGPLLSDPVERNGLASTGRVLTSMVAIACLRAQTGVGPQVLSHVFGLRKAWEDGSWREKNGESEEVVEWLVGDEGLEWILSTVDRIAEVLGSNFAPAREAKL
ncbi:conserved mitochondrial protein [Metarhizium acridum CQMa 102]|uniref:Conserved mitochondrial protein n=1 Tax=Metarhizium acridum (strain CQMa 102) TaxID=655827 RepID=E9EDG1_METAQ|nr:conserved mitochondrial protein [Metarhizium acridum CQMa 102]EFY86025.1 conserved mitochondrial protein [Metarhizium acridum CQMa 102]